MWAQNTPGTFTVRSMLGNEDMKLIFLESLEILQKHFNVCCFLKKSSIALEHIRLYLLIPKHGVNVVVSGFTPCQVLPSLGAWELGDMEVG